MPRQDYTAGLRRAVGEDPAVLRRVWVIRRTGWVTMADLVLPGLAGGLGDGPLGTAEGRHARRQAAKPGGSAKVTWLRRRIGPHRTSPVVSPGLHADAAACCRVPPAGSDRGCAAAAECGPVGLPPAQRRILVRDARQGRETQHGKDRTVPLW